MAQSQDLPESKYPRSYTPSEAGRLRRMGMDGDIQGGDAGMKEISDWRKGKKLPPSLRGRSNRSRRARR